MFHIHYVIKKMKNNYQLDFTFYFTNPAGYVYNSS